MSLVCMLYAMLPDSNKMMMMIIFISNALIGLTLLQRPLSPFLYIGVKYTSKTLILRYHYRELSRLSSHWSFICTRMSSAVDRRWPLRRHSDRVLADFSTSMKWWLGMHGCPRLIVVWVRRWVLLWKNGSGDYLEHRPFYQCFQWRTQHYCTEWRNFKGKTYRQLQLEKIFLLIG